MPCSARGPDPGAFTRATARVRDDFEHQLQQLELKGARLQRTVLVLSVLLLVVLAALILFKLVPPLAGVASGAGAPARQPLLLSSRTYLFWLVVQQ